MLDLAIGEALIRNRWFIVLIFGQFFTKFWTHPSSHFIGRSTDEGINMGPLATIIIDIAKVMV